MTTAYTEAFWNLALEHQQLSERDRIQRIEHGLDASVMSVMRQLLKLSEQAAADIANTRKATLARLQRDGRSLNSGGSERIDRILVTAQQALEVFEDRDAVITWLSSSNLSLGGESPVMHCCTGLGGRQVRRLLTGIEWGAPV